MSEVISKLKLYSNS